ncbi:hypothetical protein Mapa_002346 [Marchantia paleacea]|nr:hypothetical protein Mapa_002346 [Marchantia paleacea]
MYVIHALPPFLRAHSPDPISETKSPHGSTSGRLEKSILLDLSITTSTRALKASNPDACKIRTAIYFFQKSNRVLFVFKRQRVAHEYEGLISGPSFPHEGRSSSTSMGGRASGRAAGERMRGHQLKLASVASQTRQTRLDTCDSLPANQSKYPTSRRVASKFENRFQVKDRDRIWLHSGPG